MAHFLGTVPPDPAKKPGNQSLFVIRRKSESNVFIGSQNPWQTAIHPDLR